MHTSPPANRSLKYLFTIAALCALCVILALITVYLVATRQQAPTVWRIVPYQDARSSTNRAELPRDQRELSKAASAPRAGAATQASTSAAASVPPRIFVVLDAPVQANHTVPYPERVLVELQYAIKTKDVAKVRALTSAHMRDTIIADNPGAIRYLAAPKGLLAVQRPPGNLTADSLVNFWFSIPDRAGGTQELSGVARIRKGSSGWYLDSMTLDQAP